MNRTQRTSHHALGVASLAGTALVSLLLAACAGTSGCARTPSADSPAHTRPTSVEVVPFIDAPPVDRYPLAVRPAPDFAGDEGIALA